MILPPDLQAWVDEYDATLADADRFVRQVTVPAPSRFREPGPRYKEPAVPNIHDMIESKYFKSSDLGEEGKAKVTIAKIGRINTAKEDEEPEMHWAVRFVEFPKPMLLKPTNIKLLAKACGSDNTDDWIGKQVIVYFDETITFGNKIIGGIRIRSLRAHAAASDDMMTDSESPAAVAPRAGPPATAQPNRPANLPRGQGFDDMDDDIPF